MCGDCVCLRVCMRSCECVCLYGGCGTFVYVSCNVCMVSVGVCVGEYVFVNVCACMAIVLCLDVFLAICVL